VSHVDTADFLKKKERDENSKRDDLLKLSLKRKRFSQQFQKKIMVSTIMGGWNQEMKG